MKGNGSSHHSHRHHGSTIGSNHGDDHRRGHGSQGTHQWGEPPGASQSISHTSTSSRGYASSTQSSSQNFTSDTDPFLEEDFYIDDDDEIYLRPGEPYGTLLMPVEDPYNRLDKIKEANRELFSGPMSDRKTRTKVRFWEDRNEYYNAEEYEPSEDYEDYGSSTSVAALYPQSPTYSQSPSYRSPTNAPSPSHGDTHRRTSPRRSPPRL